MSKTFCIEPDCGQPCDSTRCAEHAVRARRRDYYRESQYYTSARWKSFSRRMRQLQPWCDWDLGNGAVCGDTRDLVCDHATPEAYSRQAAGLPFRVADFRILCRYHNGVAGSPGDR